MLTQQVSLSEATPAVLKNLRRIRTLAPEAFAGAVYLVGSTVMTTAMRLVPVDTGWLRSSRYVTRPRIVGSRFHFELGFSASYAVYVHNIFKKYIVGEWKFLSKAIDFHRATMLGEIARASAGLMMAGKGIDAVPTLHPDSPPASQMHGPRQSRRNPFLTPGARKAHSKATKRKREKSRARNQERIKRESEASLQAQREGRRGPRPGRG